MTVMIDRFFGLHQDVVRSGFWKRMLPGEMGLYVFLMHQSERLRTRQLTVRDADIHQNVGVAPRTLCNARKKLQERGLISYRRGHGGQYTYVICDPKTGKPYPGHCKERIIMPTGMEAPKFSQDVQPPIAPAASTSTGDSLEKHGVKLCFRKAATCKSIAARKPKRTHR